VNSFWVIVSSQAFGRGKSRLAAVLGPGERSAFSRAWLKHVLTTTRPVAGARHTLVVSAAADVLGLAKRLGVRALPERRRGLNAAVHQAEGFARQRGARGVIVIHADLPLLTRQDMRCMISALRDGGLVLAPDRDDSGTNALGLRGPRPFRFRFGPGSFARHLAEARRRRLRVRVVRRAGLAFDVDTPADYRRLRGNEPIRAQAARGAPPG
jgi:2-phospho-L-lactate guanylyltransferase